MHEGLPANRPETGCERWPRRLRLLSSAGELVLGRCRATNLCDYCAKQAAIEAAEMLALDGMLDAPTTLVVLTTRTATIDTAPFEEGRHQLIRALREELGRVEYASLLEFTTGYADRSGGRRRPHWNLMLKGVSDQEHELVRDAIAATWCRLVDAELQAQHVGPIYAVGGLTRYLAMHFLKTSQQPPPGFRGQRFNCSRGYFAGMSRAEAREQARRSLRSKRALWRALQAGHEGHDAELVAQLELRELDEASWELVALDVHRDTGELVRYREVVR